MLGALLEKDLTTPEYYPLTVNALVNACNQKSSRDPVVQYDESTVEQALELLRNKHLAMRVSGTGHRVEKYGHRLGETVNLGRRETALLCVLMLRGPQTVGELRGRTERMHEFDGSGRSGKCAGLSGRPRAGPSCDAHAAGPLGSSSGRGSRSCPRKLRRSLSTRGVPHLKSESVRSNARSRN